MNDELAWLPEDVRKALEVCRQFIPATDMDGKPNAWHAIELELLRLARENAELHKEDRHAHARWSEFAQLAGKEQRERIRAEAELAALKRRIAEAPTAMLADGLECVALLPVGGDRER